MGPASWRRWPAGATVGGDCRWQTGCGWWRPTGAQTSRCGRWRRCSGFRSLLRTGSWTTSPRCWPSLRLAGRARTPCTSWTARWCRPATARSPPQARTTDTRQPASRHRRQQPPGGGRRTPAAWQPQRLPSLYRVRSRSGLPRRPCDRRWWLSGHRRVDSASPSARANPPRPSPGSREQRPPTCSGPCRARIVPAEELEDPSRLPPQSLFPWPLRAHPMSLCSTGVLPSAAKRPASAASGRDRVFQ